MKRTFDEAYLILCIPKHGFRARLVAEIRTQIWLIHAASHRKMLAPIGPEGPSLSCLT